WIDRNRSARDLFAVATRVTRLGRALPCVTISWVRTKPSDYHLSLIRVARFRLNLNSGPLRALIATSDSAVWPTSITRWNFAGSHFSAAGRIGVSLSTTRDFACSTGFDNAMGFAGAAAL